MAAWLPRNCRGIHDAGRRGWLEAEGFVFNVHELQWEMTLSALRKYKEFEGDNAVPRGFVVPSVSPWPEDTWGMRLGRTVEAIIELL